MNNVEEKEVLIKDLPESYEKEQLSSFCIDPATSHVHVVAKRGGYNDWAAYVGWPDLEHLSDENSRHNDCVYYANSQHDPDDVLAHGDKLSEEVAAQIFPEWASELVYRR